MDSNKYPTHDLLKQFVPIRDIPGMLDISLDEVDILIKKDIVMYALLKDPNGNKRIPHVNIEQLSNYIQSKEVISNGTES